MSTHTVSHSLFDAAPRVRDSDRKPVPRHLRLVDVATATSRPYTPTWTTPTAGESRFGRGGAFALVAIGHVVVIGLLATVKLQMDRPTVQPTEVVIVADQTDKLDLPAPKKPNMEMPQVDVPIVPIVIETVNPEATPITVVERQVQSVASAATGAPKEVSAVEYVREPTAKYPSAARALKQRGVVTLRTLIDADGQPRDVKVHRSSGYKLLDEAARTAVLNALFKPYAENGRAIPVYVLIPVEFGAAS